MIHNINFTINLELIGLSHKQFIELQNMLMGKIIEDKIEPLNFEDINKILCLSGRKYYPSSIEHPPMDRYMDDYVPKVSKVEINA